MFKLKPWMYFTLAMCSIAFLLAMILIDALVFGVTSVATLSTFIPLILAFLTKVDRKE